MVLSSLCELRGVSGPTPRDGPGHPALPDAFSLEPTSGILAKRPYPTSDSHSLSAEPTYYDLMAQALMDMTEKRVHFDAPNRQARLNLAYVHYREWCLQNGVESPCVPFTAKLLKAQMSKWPMMSQNQAKGAQTRHLLYWICCLCEQAMATAPSEYAEYELQKFEWFGCVEWQHCYCALCVRV